jgi:hypothetical protein
MVGDEAPHLVREAAPSAAPLAPELRVNARVAGDPESLRAIVQDVVQSLAPEARWRQMQSFRPAAPVPEKGRRL